MHSRGKEYAVGKALLRAALKAQDSPPCIAAIGALFQRHLRCLRLAGHPIRYAAVLVLVSGLAACGGGGGGGSGSGLRSPANAPPANPPVPVTAAPANPAGPADTTPPADDPPEAIEEPAEENPAGENPNPGHSPNDGEPAGAADPTPPAGAAPATPPANQPAAGTPPQPAVPANPVPPANDPPEPAEEPAEENPVSEDTPTDQETPTPSGGEAPAEDEEPLDAGGGIIAPDGDSPGSDGAVEPLRPDDSAVSDDVELVDHGSSSGQGPSGDGESDATRGVSSDEPSPAEVWAQGCPALPAYYCNQWGLEMVKAGQAYAKLHTLPGSTEPGEDVVLGFLDLGLENDYGPLDGTGFHPAFGDKDIFEIRWPTIPPNDGSRETDTHGTSVASVAAAVPLTVERSEEEEALGICPECPLPPETIDRSTQGVAPGATVISLTSSGWHPRRDGNYMAVSPGEIRFRQPEWLALVDSAIRSSVNILNVSLGYEGIIDSYTKEELQHGFGAVVHSLAQADVENDKMLIVWAAGNANRNSCLNDDDSKIYNDNLCVNDRINARSVEVLPGLVARFDELQSHMAAVVAIGKDGRIASFSNRCGIAKANCIAAPGVDVRVAYFGNWPEGSALPLFTRHNNYTDSDGTSFAAPMVTGGLALVMHRFRDQLYSEAVLARLFETANDKGIYSDENVYGHGLMDLDAATEPIGGPTIITAPDVSLPGPPLRTTSLSLGTAFGAAPKRSLAGREIAAFDSMGAPFWHDLGALVGSGGSEDLQQKLRAMLEHEYSPDTLSGQPSLGLGSYGQRVQLAFAVEDGVGFSGLAGPALALSLSSADSPLAATAFSSEGTGGPTTATGLTLDWKPLGLRMGLLAESSSSLGTVASGGFGHLSSSTVFAGMERAGQAGSWNLEASAEIGAAMPSAGHGMLETLDTMTASRLALRASREAGHLGQIRLSLEQPLRVETAPASFRAPVGRTKDGSVLLDRWTADLAPKGRQVDLGAWWNGAWRQSGQLRLGAVYSRHPGHDAEARPSLSLLAGYRLTF